jgi:hypothetical protein
MSVKTPAVCLNRIVSLDMKDLGWLVKELVFEPSQAFLMRKKIS